MGRSDAGASAEPPHHLQPATNRTIELIVDRSYRNNRISRRVDRRLPPILPPRYPLSITLPSSICACVVVVVACKSFLYLMEF